MEKTEINKAKLKEYMESAGKNDASRTCDEGIYEIENEDKLKKILDEIDEELTNQDWSTYGFDYLSEKSNIIEELGKESNSIPEEALHDIAADAFIKYYVPAFLDKFSLSVRESWRRLRDRKVSIQISEDLRHKLQMWDEIHYTGRRRTYERIIQELLEREKGEEPDFLKWHLKNTEKLVLESIKNGSRTSTEIREDLRANHNIDMTLRAYQSILDSLVEKKLIIRMPKPTDGRAYTYSLNGEILK